jgi:hypothetical protein
MMNANRLNLKNVMAMAICLVVTTMFFIACDKETYLETGIIRYYPPEDNCGAYMLEIEVKGQDFPKLYKPDKLPKKFEVEYIQVKVKYSITETRHSCDFGGHVPVVEIIKIVERK